MWEYILMWIPNNLSFMCEYTSITRNLSHLLISTILEDLIMGPVILVSTTGRHNNRLTIRESPTVRGKSDLGQLPTCQASHWTLLFREHNMSSDTTVWELHWLPWGNMMGLKIEVGKASTFYLSHFSSHFLMWDYIITWTPNNLPFHVWICVDPSRISAINDGKHIC